MVDEILRPIANNVYVPDEDEVRLEVENILIRLPTRNQSLNTSFVSGNNRSDKIRV